MHRNADRLKVMHFKWERETLLHALTNVRQRRWLSPFVNLISFVQLAGPGQIWPSFEGVLWLLHRCIWLMTVFIYCHCRQCSRKCAIHSACVYLSIYEMHFNWILPYSNGVLSTLIETWAWNSHCFDEILQVDALRTYFMLLNDCFSVTGNYKKFYVAKVWNLILLSPNIFEQLRGFSLLDAEKSTLKKSPPL